MSGVAAAPGTCPADAGQASARPKTRAGTMRANISVLLFHGMAMHNGIGGETRPRRIAQDRLHERYLLALLDDDRLGKAPQPLILAEAQLDDRHVDGALMMRYHHPRKIAVGIASRRDMHGAMHSVHRIVHQ